MSRPPFVGSVIARASVHGSLESNVLAGLAKHGYQVKTVDHSSPFSLKLAPASLDQPPVTIGVFDDACFVDTASVEAALAFAARLSKQVNAMALVPLSSLGCAGYADFQGQLLSLHLAAAMSGTTPTVRALPLVPAPSTPAGVLAALLAIVAGSSRSRAAATATHMDRIAAEASAAAQTYVLEGVPGVRAPPPPLGPTGASATTAAASGGATVASGGWATGGVTGGGRGRPAGVAPVPVASAAAAAVAAGAGPGGSVQCARADLLLGYVGSIGAISQASAAQLRAAVPMGPDQARAIAAFFHSRGDGPSEGGGGEAWEGEAWDDSDGVG